MPYELEDDNGARYRLPASMHPAQRHVGGAPRARAVRGYGSDQWFTVLDGIREPATLDLIGVLHTDRDDLGTQSLLNALQEAAETAVRLYRLDHDGNDVEYLELRGVLPLTVSPDGIDGSLLTVTVPLVPARDTWSVPEADGYDSGYEPGPDPGDFTPTDLDNLALWLDASDAATITLNGSDVSAWADKSGDGRDFSQGSASAQPEYVAAAHNALAALRFTGSEQMLGDADACDLFRNVAAVTVYIVCLTTDHNTSGFALWAANNSSLQIRFAIAVSTAFDDHLVAYRRLDGDGQQQYRTQVEWPEDQLVIIGVHHDWASQVGRIYEDGALLEDATLSTSAGSTSNTASAAVRIGSDDAAVRWRGDICEILVYRDTHTTEEREQVQDYLAEKWGITL